MRTIEMKKDFSTINVSPEVRYKVDVWQVALEERWGRSVTYEEVIDFLTDMAGVPEEAQ
jgi:hypothetical protein